MSSNPIWAAYIAADPFGQAIFVSLFALSVGTWLLIGWKGWLLWRVQRLDQQFERSWKGIQDQPLALRIPVMQICPPFLGLYSTLQTEGLRLIERNQCLHSSSSLQEADLRLLQESAQTSCSTEIDRLESYLFLLSTSVSLAPFLGLLGTVWGILDTFTQLHGASFSNEAFLAGLSTALATTVLGLVIAIPALIGYNVLRHLIRSREGELARFAQQMLNQVTVAHRA